MTNLTLAVDAETLRRARVRAAQESTSVNAVVRQFLEEYADNRNAQWEARMKLHALAEQSTASSGGYKWTRDELYDR